ncbi:GWxTD domain-containing protein [Hymenobacter latericus]|uniref:GWxTD domain-containing protein n=1 Tax=Hymenobacter sp. YIM 151858-1 TaxID=2987688 RepID=UPI002225C6AD|nr:GWxTD domain-containing protein [Hymenobacter sp. YIM 151858-1]UYZ59072.1 GWxTD domain-containing protein [Hymenobacter sp. YIM 151858-1]
MRVLLVLLLLFGGAAANGQRLPAPARLNLAGLYQTQQHAVAEARREGDSLRLYVRFPRSGGVLQPRQGLRVVAWAGYDARQPLWQDTVRLRSFVAADAEQPPVLDFCVPVAALQSAKMLAVWPGNAMPDHPGTAAWLALTPEVLSRPFVLTDSSNQPLLRRYLLANEVVQIDCYGPDRPATLRRYPADFAPALPPHTNPAIQGASSRTLTAQAVTKLRPGQWLRITEPGLYTLQVADATPLGLLAQPPGYPLVRTAPELIEPLRYLSTSAERERLLRAESPKRAVDQFWLRAAADQQPIARQLIRTFYGRVEDANRLFSAHKPGWMTDRGLLYVVLGPPERVLRTSTEERWEYNDPVQGGPYVFRPKPSTFAAEYYELVRRPEHEWLWFRAVEQWRKGLTVPQGAAR